MANEELKPGVKVVVRSGFGLEPPETVVVECYEEDIKNGCPGIEYTDGAGEHRWAYVDQIVRIIG